MLRYSPFCSETFSRVAPRNQSLPPGEDSRLGAIHHVEFAQDIADMSLDRLFADYQFGGYFGVWETVRDEAQYFQFAVAQVGKEVGCVSPRASQLLYHARGDARMQDGFAARRHAHNTG